MISMKLDENGNLRLWPEYDEQYYPGSRFIYEGLEPPIRNLVFALHEIQYRTEGSCEGHVNDEDRHPFPWAGISPFQGALSLEKSIESYSKSQDIKWKLYGGRWLRPIEEATSMEELKALQESATTLAIYIIESLE
jgi:hypothetical protein